jgi:hypothetical protein
MSPKGTKYRNYKKFLYQIQFKTIKISKMKQVTVNLYKFSELSEEAKEKAIERFADINVDHDWYEFFFEEAKDLGFRINGFDIYRNHEIDIDLIDSEIDICQAIIKSHGEMCDTYKMAEKFLAELTQCQENYDAVEGDEEIDYDAYLEIADKLADCKKEFQQELSECYLQMLRENYEYYTSKEAIIETIEANDYDFTEEGKLY